MSLKYSHRGHLQQLQELGLSRSESLVYICLLEADTSEGISGYEVAARAEVPRSAVYAVLNSLVDRGAIAAHGKPQRFFGIPPTQWLSHYHQEHTTLINQLSSSLETITQLQTPAPIWIIRRHREVISNMQTLIQSAEHFLCISVLPRDLELLNLPINPQFPMIVHSPATCTQKISGSCWFEQGPEPKNFNRMILTDRRHCLQGFFSENASNEVIRSENLAIYDTAISVFEQRIIQAANRLAINADSDCLLIKSQRVMPSEL